jgi:arylsulfatase A-like enzyme
MLDRVHYEPFVLYVNYQDLHHPYFDEWMDRVFIEEGRTDIGFFRPENAGQIFRQYANAAHHLDRSIRELFEGLEARDLLDKTVIVIVGDHSESFYENGLLGHFFAVDARQRATPLFVVNGRGSHEVPLGQEEVVEVILKSIDRRDHGTFSFRADPRKRVLVFTGPLEQPQKIAWIRPSDLITYDFKIGRVQFGEGQAWLKASELEDGVESGRLFEGLVHRWESEVLLAKRDLAYRCLPSPSRSWQAKGNGSSQWVRD